MIWRDLRYAARALIRTPGFLAVAFVAIALGIGVNTTILGIVNALLLRPLPVGHSDRVLQVFTTDTHLPAAIRTRTSIFSITGNRTACSPEWPVTALLSQA